ncbi:MAG: aldolase/citrate lyase family protein [Chloroflexi bacterium]|nr:aldolase/citrate lyase family protein [Chloroflexota bacterium]
MPDAKSLKQRIRSGEILIGVSAPLNATKGQLEDILSKDDYAFVTTDSQHSPFNEERLVEFCGLCGELGMPVQLRIKNTRHTYLIGNILDLGPLMIEVPMVEEEATVDEAIENFYYPQFGKRSVAGGARYGLRGREGRLQYAEWWNNNGVLCLQLETLTAVTNAAKLAKPGVDCFTWGPQDLTFDIEGHPHHPLQTVDDCVKHVLKQIEGMDVKISFRNYTPDLRQKYIDMGVTVLMERPK